MFSNRLIAAGIMAIVASSSLAQVPQTGAGSLGSGGPGGVVSGATAWYGVRAYNTAYALSQGRLVTLRRTNDNTTCNFNSTANGDFGVSDGSCSAGTGLTAFAFAAHGTCTGTISGTTLTCAGASATPTTGDTLSGTGITVALVVSTCGTFTSGAGTCTIGTYAGLTIPTISVGETISFKYNMTVTAMADQTGSGATVTQPTANNQPAFYYPCLTSVPCVGFSSGVSIDDNLSGTIGFVVQPFTISHASSRRGLYTSLNVVASVNAGNVTAGYYTSANQAYFRTSAVGYVPETAADNAHHNIQAVFNGASSILSIDGTNFTGLNPGSSNSGTAISLGDYTAGGGFEFAGTMFEAGFWPVAFSTTQATAMCHNQYTYYGIGTSC